MTSGSEQVSRPGAARAPSASVRADAAYVGTDCPRGGIDMAASPWVHHPIMISLSAPRVRTIAWRGDALVDWVGGVRVFHLDPRIEASRQILPSRSLRLRNPLASGQSGSGMSMNARALHGTKRTLQESFATVHRGTLLLGLG
jgi:hypothetical protein